MLKRLSILLFVAAMSVAYVSAQGSKLTVPVSPTPAYDGKQMYVSYCASCHGLDGRGKGPTAAALKDQPADLSMLTKNNKGAFPENHVAATLRFGVETSAHGSKEMPVWGPALLRVDHQAVGNQEELALRIANLVHYVETLQAK